jgi:hypothetical protein
MTRYAVTIAIFALAAHADCSLPGFVGLAASYVPLPPAVPVPSMPVLALPGLNRGQILQLWGHSQAVALRDTQVPRVLKDQYQFDMVIMIPLDA